MFVEYKALASLRFPNSRKCHYNVLFNKEPDANYTVLLKGSAFFNNGV